MITTRRSTATPLLAFALLTALSGCTTGPAAPADAPTARPARPHAVTPAAQPPAPAPADTARVKQLIGFGEYGDAYAFAHGEGDDGDADRNVMVGVSDLAQPIGDVDAAWQPGPYRFSVVCLGGGRVRVTVGTRPKTEWTAPCNGTVSARESVTTPRVLDLSLTGEAGATGPVGYRADRLPPTPPTT
ncbi:hypothetical protein ACWCQL_10095 [Streptomyces sp. NPDC002073]